MSEFRAPPAIVVARGYTGLGALRSLAMAGIPAYVACPADDFVTRSRWFRRLPGTQWDGTVGPRTGDILAALPFERAVLVPGRDDAALWLSDLAGSALGERFSTSSSRRATLEILQDKRRFGEFLAGTGIAHPRTFTIRSREDIDAIPFETLDRVFVKPADSQRFARITGNKGVWAEGRAAFESVWRRLDAQGLAVIAQEYVPGASSEHFFVDGFRDRDGGFAGLFARRRVRIFPADFGNSSYCASIPLREVQPAVASVCELLERLDYRGIFSAEFKRDARDGSFRILEVNTRAWWYVEFAARCGVNVCEMAYCDAIGAPVPQAGRYPVRVGCVSLANDIRSVLSAQPARVSPPRLLWQWLRAHFHVFRVDDPRPGLTLAWRLFCGRARKALGLPASAS